MGKDYNKKVSATAMLRVYKRALKLREIVLLLAVSVLYRVVRPRGLAGVAGRGAALAGLRAEGGTQARGGPQTQELDALRRG